MYKFDEMLLTMITMLLISQYHSMIQYIIIVL